MPALACDWQSRVLEAGSTGLIVEEQWKMDAYLSYREKLRAADYPCFFGQTAEARGEMLYTFVPGDDLEELLQNMKSFVSLLQTPGHRRSSLVAFFQPDSLLVTHAQFVGRFWTALQFLHDHDSGANINRTPDDPLWEFSFESVEMFVVGTSPTYRRRRSRDLGAGMVLIFQPRHLFLDPATLEPIAPEVRYRLHNRMLAYDGMAVHPDIGFYGDPVNREWKQYALPDDNEPETGTCPFHARGRQA